MAFNPKDDNDLKLFVNYDDAKKAISEILERGKIPIVAGGTGLYFRVLLETYGLPRVEANPKLREELD